MDKLGGLGTVLGEQRAPLCPFSRSMQLCARPQAKPSEKGIELDFSPTCPLGRRLRTTCITVRSRATIRSNKDVPKGQPMDLAPLADGFY